MVGSTPQGDTHGIDPGRERCSPVAIATLLFEPVFNFVMDGSKRLRTAIDAVFGAEAPVQRCRNHKLRNVLARQPRQQQAQTAFSRGTISLGSDLRYRQ